MIFLIWKLLLNFELLAHHKSSFVFSQHSEKAVYSEQKPYIDQKLSLGSS